MSQSEKPCCKVVEGRVCGQPSSVMWVIGGEYVYACDEHASALTDDLYVGETRDLFEGDA